MSIFNKSKETEREVELADELKAFKEDYEDQQREHSQEIEDLQRDHKSAISELEHNHKLTLAQKEYDLKHFKDDEIVKLRTELATANEGLAVAKKENEMLDKLVNVNADIVNVKELITSLIAKLPEVNLKELTIHTNQKS